MDEIEALIEILEYSQKKNGSDKPITIGHLLAMLKKAQRKVEAYGYDCDMIQAKYDMDGD